METEGSLSCSQEPATGPCPEPGESIPRLPILFPEDPSYPFSVVPVVPTNSKYEALRKIS